jgi:hypothetical protein
MASIVAASTLYIGTPSRIVPDEADVPNTSETTVQCKFAAKSRKVTCGAADKADCTKLEKEMLCRDQYLDVIRDSINNWESKKIWNDYQNKVTWFDLTSASPGTHKGKECLRVRMNATVWLCPKGKEPVRSGTGYGRMVSYSEGLFSDDLVIEALETYTGEAATTERTLRLLSALPHSVSDIAEWLSVQKPINEDAVRKELLFAGISPSKVFEKANGRGSQ